MPVGTSIPIVLFAKGRGRLVSLMSADICIDPEEITLPPEMGSLAGAVVGEILLGNRLYGDVLEAESCALRLALRPTGSVWSRAT